LDWKFYKDYDPSRFTVENNVLTLKAKGNSAATSSPILFVAGNHAYEVEVEIEKDPAATAGILLYYNDRFFGGTGFDSDRRYRYRMGQASGRGRMDNVNHLWLRIRNDNQVITASYSYDGTTWEREEWALELSGYNHNTLYEFQSLLPALFASGEGEVKFKNFKYTIL
jgi:beta-xylosidase